MVPTVRCHPIRPAQSPTGAGVPDLPGRRQQPSTTVSRRHEISADPGDTIEPDAPGRPSAQPSYLPLSSIGQDQGQLWLAQAIKSGYGVATVFADAWSAPPFMKVNDSVDNGGALCGVPGATCPSGDWRQAYANYLRQYAADYSAAGCRSPISAR